MGSTFQNKAVFESTRFEDIVDFSGSTFQNTSNFEFSLFQSTADFGETEFQKKANFSGATFQSSAMFNGVIFQNTADFSRLHVSDSAYFYVNGASLPNLINFSRNIEIHHLVDFTAAGFGGVFAKLANMRYNDVHYINLYNSDIAKVKMDYRHFRLCFFSGRSEDSTLNLSANFDFDTLIYNKVKYPLNDTALYLKMLKNKAVRDYLQRIFPSVEIKNPSGDFFSHLKNVFQWYKKREAVINQPASVIKVFLQNCFEQGYFPDALPDDEIEAVYEKVLKNFELSGQLQSNKTLDIEYRDFKNGWFILPHIWYCYGYHKEWIFWWTFGFIIFFTIITTFLIGELNRNPDDGGVYYIKNIPTYLRSKPWYKRIWYALMYTSTIFFLLSLKIENLNFKNKWGVVYVFLVYSVGLLCLGYMANFVLQK